MRKTIDRTIQDTIFVCDVCKLEMNSYGEQHLKFNDVSFDVHDACMGKLLFEHFNPKK